MSAGRIYQVLALRWQTTP